MLSLNGLAHMLFVNMYQKPMNRIPTEELIPEGMISESNLLPLHHPADLPSAHPDFNRRTHAARCIARQLETDYKARQMGLNAIYRMIRAFRFDYLQLKAGFAPVVPAHDAFDSCLNTYATCMKATNKFIIDTFVDLYQQLYELTQLAIEVTPEAALEFIREQKVYRETSAAQVAE
jgi:hypothetical protein